MTVTSTFLAIVLAALTLIAFGVIGFAAGLSLLAYLKREELRRTVDALSVDTLKMSKSKASESRLARRSDWPGARIRPSDFLRPDDPEGSSKGPAP